MLWKAKKYSDNYIDYPGVGIITDEQVAKFVREHTHWWERLDYHRMTDCALTAQCMLMGVYDIPEREKWFFTEDDVDGFMV